MNEWMNETFRPVRPSTIIVIKQWATPTNHTAHTHIHSVLWHKWIHYVCKKSRGKSNNICLRVKLCYSGNELKLYTIITGSSVHFSFFPLFVCEHFDHIEVPAKVVHDNSNSTKSLKDYYCIIKDDSLDSLIWTATCSVAQEEKMEHHKRVSVQCGLRGRIKIKHYLFSQLTKKSTQERTFVVVVVVCVTN